MAWKKGYQKLHSTLFRRQPSFMRYEIGIKNSDRIEIKEGDILSPTRKLGKMWAKGDQEIGVVTYIPEYARYGLNFYTIYGGEGCSLDIPGQQIHFYTDWYIIGNVFDSYKISGMVHK